MATEGMEPGAFTFSHAAYQFERKRLRSLTCRWCKTTLLLRIPSASFLCNTCDWPALSKDIPPDGFRQ